MTERGLQGVDGPPACPFVAFEDDRDERSTSPDHRHRCYAEEGAPAPRAAAHQEAYCLSSAFPVCPTFQAWARREAARTKASDGAVRSRDRDRDDRAAAAAGASGAIAGGGMADAGAIAGGGAAAGASGAIAGGGAAGAGAIAGGGTAAGASGAIAGRGAADAGAGAPRSDDEGGWGAAEEWSGRASPGDEQPVETTPRRNPPRDWAAPPPWAGIAQGPGSATVDGPAFTGRQPREGQGLAGSAADRLAGGVPPSTGPAASPSPRPGRGAEPDPDLAALVGRGERPSASPPVRPGAHDDVDDLDAGDTPLPVRRQPVSSTRSDRGRAAAPARPHREHVQGDGPSWERSRRNEAYPMLKTRAGLGGLPGLPRVAVLFGALLIAAVALFFLPALLGVGGDGDAPTASPTRQSVAPTATPEPTPVPAPTPQTYTIKSGDTLSGIARSFGLTLDDLLEANADTITDPNRIAVGDVIIIPVAPPDEVPDAGGSAEPSP
ncbi:MAG: LysM peptidoglycan-binding domain-containing protein [Candidatus Limnocylindria bacterium]